MKKSIIIVLAGLMILTFFIFINSCAKKEKVIKIGAILPLTGGAAKYGESAKRAIDLAVEEINSTGGIKGSKIKVIYEDDQALPDKGVSAIQKLITVDKVPVVIGAMPSSVTLAMAPIAEKNKVVLFSPASSNPKITEAGDYIFRNDVSDIFEGGKMADEAWRRLKFRKIAVLYINNDYGAGIKDAFVYSFTILGGEIVVTENFEQGTTDFRTQLTKIKQDDPEAVYIVGYKEQIQILKQFRELGLKSQILATIMLEDPEIIQKVGDSAEGAIYTYRAYDPNSEQKEIKEFVENFKVKYGIEPDNWAAQCYDALNIIALAIKDSGYNSDSIKKALYGIKNFPGVSGLTTFDENGDVIKPIKLKTVKNGKFVIISE
ncbi:MAG: penicillin-binding protein activator [Candidatus Cloacimonetes bacterium]|nr:penicillin-binding protein activator [Candidatus Cloacimonadota bacterium]